MSILNRITRAVRAFSYSTPPDSGPAVRYGNYYDYASTGNRDLRLNDEDIGIAYTTVVGVYRATTFWTQAVGGRLNRIMVPEPDGDVVLAESADKIPRHAFYTALRQHRQRYLFSLIPRIVYSDILFGETYVQKLRTHKVPAGFRWLNPMGMQPFEMGGEIQRFLYTPNTGETVYSYPAEEVAYRIYGINAFDDLAGMGSVVPALGAVNLNANVKKALNAFFRNNALPLAVVTPGQQDGVTATWTKENKAEVDREFSRFLTGASNRGRVLTAIKPMQINTFEPPDVEKQYTLHEPTLKEIALAFGVPVSLLGDASDTRFKDGDPVRLNWWQTTGKPYADDLSLYMNDLLNFIDPFSESYFEFDFSDLERDNTTDAEQATTISTDVSTGLITLNEARIARGYPSDPRLDGFLMVAGQLVRIDDLQPTLAETEEPPVPPRTPPPAEPPPERAHVHADPHDHGPRIRAFSPKQATPLDELKAWRKFARSNRSRPFEPEHLRGDIGDALQAVIAGGDAEAIRIAFDRAEERLYSWRAMPETRADFQADFAELLDDALSGKVTKAQFIETLYEDIGIYGREAYEDGLEAGGVLDRELTEDDLKEYASLHTSQRAYITKFASEVYGPAGIGDALRERKPAMWLHKSIEPFYYAGFASAKRNQMMEWELGNTEEHCKDCPRLNGQRHRLYTWRRKGWMPGGDRLECEGFNCECELVPVKAKARGRF